MADKDRVSHDSDDYGYRVPAIDRGFTILRLLAEHGSLTLADVVDLSGLNKSTAYYVLRTLVSLDVADVDEATRTYSLGPGLVPLGAAASAKHGEIALVKRRLAELMETFNVTIVLYRRLGREEVMIVDKIEQPHSVRITVETGTRMPIQGGSFGRAFLAFDPPTELEEALRGGLHRFTSKSQTDVGAFRAELATVRSRGWALDEEGFALGVSAVAAPIFGADGVPALVAAAVGFTSLMTADLVFACGSRLRALCDDVGSNFAPPHQWDSSPVGGG